MHSPNLTQAGSGNRSGDERIELVPLEDLEERDVAYSDSTLSDLIKEEDLEEARRLAERYHAGLWKILSYRFGLLDGETHSIDEAASEFGVTRERIRHLCENGFFYWRARQRFAKARAKIPLRDYMDDDD